MTKKTRFASAVQYQEKRNITRMVRMVLCAVVMILLTVSAGFADPLPNDPSVDWSIADGVLTLKPSEGYEALEQVSLLTGVPIPQPLAGLNERKVRFSKVIRPSDLAKAVIEEV